MFHDFKKTEKVQLSQYFKIHLMSTLLIKEGILCPKNINKFM